jgi:hypothetical protein
VPVLIGFLASLLGIDGLADKVQDIIQSIRKRIDDAITGLIDKAKEWFKGNGKDKRKAESEDDVSDEDRAKHEQYAGEIKTELIAMSMNEDESYDAFRARIATKMQQLEQEYQVKLTDGINVSISFIQTEKDDEQDGNIDIKIRIAPNDTEDEVVVVLDRANFEVPVNVGEAIMARYNKGMFYAEIKEISGEGNDMSIRHEFRAKNLNEKDVSNSYEDFADAWEAGDIKAASEQQKTRARHAEGKPEPLANLIIATVGTYRSNILNDLKVLFATDSIPRQLFLDLYSNMPSPFNTALAGLLDQSNLTQADIKSVFQGYEIHHVIPANFLWENDTIAKLFSQDSIQFGYNDLDNLTYIPASNHREDNQWCHDDYDEAIADLIAARVKPLVDRGRYTAALNQLKTIISEIRVLFRDEVLKPNGKTLDKLL